MDNLLKSKTRLAFVQIIFENLSTNKNTLEILKNFNLNYKGTFIENFHDKSSIKFEFNSNFLDKLVLFYNQFTKEENHITTIDRFIKFNRSFKKWDLINQSIILAALSEIKNIENSKVKIVLNDYLNVGKTFVDDKDIGIINAILDKMIYENT